MNHNCKNNTPAKAHTYTCTIIKIILLCTYFYLEYLCMQLFFKNKLISTNLQILISLHGVLCYIVVKTLNIKTLRRISHILLGIAAYVVQPFGTMVHVTTQKYLLLIEIHTVAECLREEHTKKTLRFDNLRLGIMNNSLSRNTVLECKIYVVFI